MRIAINGYYWERPGTGSGQYVRSLVSAMAHLAPENDYLIIIPRDIAGRDEIISLADISARVFLCPEQVNLRRWSENIAKVEFEQNIFPGACKRERADIAHVPYFAPPLAALEHTVVTIHDLIPIILPAYRGPFLVRRYTDLVSIAARHAQAVIADSDCSKRDIVQRLGIPAERVRTIYLAADARFKPVVDPAALAAFRARFNLPSSGKFLLYLGGFDQRKNVRVIIEAFSYLPELYETGYRLVLGGAMLGRDSDFFPDPHRIAREIGLPDGAIQNLGWIPEEDKPLLYASGQMFVFPSLYEGFGLPPLEAMACGTPTISSDAASLPEIVGEAALTVDPTSALAWTEAIRAVAKDENRRAQMRERGIAQAREFSWERTARETLEVYGSLLAHRVPAKDAKGELVS